MQQRDGGWREGRRSRREGKKGMEEEESVRPRGGQVQKTVDPMALIYLFKFQRERFPSVSSWKELLGG